MRNSTPSRTILVKLFSLTILTIIQNLRLHRFHGLIPEKRKDISWPLAALPTRWMECHEARDKTKRMPSLSWARERVCCTRATPLGPAPKQEKNDLEHRLYSRSTASLWKLAGCTEIDWLQVGGMRGGPPAGARMAFRRGYTHETAAVFVYFPGGRRAT